MNFHQYDPRPKFPKRQKILPRSGAMHHDDGNDGDGDGDDGDGDGDGDAGDGDDGASADDDDLTVCRTSSILRISDWMSSRLALKFSRV